MRDWEAQNHHDDIHLSRNLAILFGGTSNIIAGLRACVEIFEADKYGALCEYLVIQKNIRECPLSANHSLPSVSGHVGLKARRL